MQDIERQFTGKIIDLITSANQGEKQWMLSNL